MTAVNTGQKVSFHILAHVKLWKEIAMNNLEIYTLEIYTSEGIFFDSSC